MNKLHSAYFPKSLTKGYNNFKAGEYAQNHLQYQALAQEGQHPKTMVIGCCDSRATPEVIFGAKPGELFVFRNIANLVHPYEPKTANTPIAAALEFAVQVLKVERIIILGHSQCGGVEAALAQEASHSDTSCMNTEPSSIQQWIAPIKLAASALIQDKTISANMRQTTLEQASTLKSLDNLRSFPSILDKENQGTLALYAAWFDIGAGALLVADSFKTSPPQFKAL